MNTKILHIALTFTLVISSLKIGSSAALPANQFQNNSGIALHISISNLSNINLLSSILITPLMIDLHTGPNHDHDDMIHFFNFDRIRRRKRALIRCIFLKILLTVVHASILILITSSLLH